MREVDLDSLTGKDLISHTSISEAFKSYLMETLDYGEDEADFVVSTDFENPYDTPFIMQDYEGQYAVDDKEYEVRFCYTDFCACGLFHLSNVEPFEFYMFIDLDTLPDQTVGAYRNAKKLYLI